ncbi:hypothetical protein A33M_0380 [Rhodovulum sp. PH10]|uniref:DUF6460 domain-containing protein n=1 Tax=Rhodovulum sp. PH10 TaxID=1187851 RepID=UPI00027C258E|nr:DUF6460 domain-containing protein [Rhodovulum sp. PH10]EJW10210.1 hypothetical protein A33M_0380 [Rhodovulum sp. PH10]
MHTTAKVAVASLIVGTIFGHFGITLETLANELGLSFERVGALVERAFGWAMPNLVLGAVIIVPIWALVYILRPPGQSSE